MKRQGTLAVARVSILAELGKFHIYEWGDDDGRETTTIADGPGCIFFWPLGSLFIHLPQQLATHPTRDGDPFLPTFRNLRNMLRSSEKSQPRLLLHPGSRYLSRIPTIFRPIPRQQAPKHFGLPLHATPLCTPILRGTMSTYRYSTYHSARCALAAHAQRPIVILAVLFLLSLFVGPTTAVINVPVDCPFGNDYVQVVSFAIIRDEELIRTNGGYDGVTLASESTHSPTSPRPLLFHVSAAPS